MRILQICIAQENTVNQINAVFIDIFVNLLGVAARSAATPT